MGESTAQFLYYVFVAPIWWMASYLASYFYPYEDDKRHTAIATVAFVAIYAVIIYLALLLSE
jgi:hypothetical protein